MKFKKRTITHFTTADFVLCQHLHFLMLFPSFKILWHSYQTTIYSKKRLGTKEIMKRFKENEWEGLKDSK